MYIDLFSGIYMPNRVPLSENFFWNHRFSVRGWYQVSWARSSKHWVESRSCQNSIFYFSPLPIKTPFKGMKTVNKFISIDIIFVQTAFNWANTCVYTIYWVDTFKPILATSRVILELNPFGILIRGPIHTGRPMVPCALKNSGRSIVQCCLFLMREPLLRPPTIWMDGANETVVWMPYELNPVAPPRPLNSRQ